jgi:hypothetical protein
LGNSVTGPIAQHNPRIAREMANLESESFKALADSVESHPLDWMNFHGDLMDSGSQFPIPARATERFVSAT